MPPWDVCGATHWHQLEHWSETHEILNTDHYKVLSHLTVPPWDVCVTINTLTCCVWINTMTPARALVTGTWNFKHWSLQGPISLNCAALGYAVTINTLTCCVWIDTTTPAKALQAPAILNTDHYKVLSHFNTAPFCGVPPFVVWVGVNTVMFHILTPVQNKLLQEAHTILNTDPHQVLSHFNPAALGCLWKNTLTPARMLQAPAIFKTDHSRVLSHFNTAPLSCVFVEQHIDTSRNATGTCDFKYWSL